MQLRKKPTSKISPPSTSRFVRMQSVLVFAGLLWLSGCAGVVRVSSQTTPYGDDYYGDNYDDSYSDDQDLQGIDNPYDYYFHNRLQRHGEWIPIAGFGNVWRPLVVASWTPYTLGYWAASERGWMWVSYEPFGDIVYHYGNWGHLEGHGWCWFPGRDWAPNHVSWADWQDGIGWYPTPPSVTIQLRIDLSPSYDRYVWVSHRHFLDRDFSRRRERNPSRLWRGAGPPRGDLSRGGGHPTVDVVQRWTGKPAPKVQIQEVQRKTRRGEVRVGVPDQQTREQVRNKGAKITRPWLTPKQQKARQQDKNKGQGKGQGKDKGGKP